MSSTLTPLSRRRNTTPPALTSVTALRSGSACVTPSPAHEQLGDLNGVRGRPFPQIVGDHPEVERPREIRVGPHATDENLIPPGGVTGRGEILCRAGHHQAGSAREG